jgi:hypothetical protein
LDASINTYITGPFDVAINRFRQEKYKPLVLIFKPASLGRQQNTSIPALSACLPKSATLGLCHGKDELGPANIQCLTIPFLADGSNY